MVAATMTYPGRQTEHETGLFYLQVWQPWSHITRVEVPLKLVTRVPVAAIVVVQKVALEQVAQKEGHATHLP